MSRFDSPIGDCGLPIGDVPPAEPGRVRPFDAFCRFNGRKYSITIWAVSQSEAEAWCQYHGLEFGGEICATIPA